MGAQLTAAKRIAEINERLAQATKPPWSTAYHHHWFVEIGERSIPFNAETDDEISAAGNDAIFVAWSRDDIPWLLQRLERAEQLLRECDDSTDKLGCEIKDFLAGEDE